MDLIDDSWKLSKADLIHQIAAYLWVHKGDEHKNLYEQITGARIAYELYSRLTTNKDIDTFRTQCIMGIVDYIKKHPNATEDELTKSIEKSVAVFKDQLEHM